MGPGSDFTTFVQALAANALLNLGAIPDPETNATTTNLPLAELIIDQLAMLEDKTRGNLAADEHALLQKLLYDLRLRFVHLSKSHR